MTVQSSRTFVSSSTLHTAATCHGKSCHFWNLPRTVTSLWPVPLITTGARAAADTPKSRLFRQYRVATVLSPAPVKLKAPAAPLSNGGAGETWQHWQAKVFTDKYVGPEYRVSSCNQESCDEKTRPLHWRWFRGMFRRHRSQQPVVIAPVSQTPVVESTSSHTHTSHDSPRHLPYLQMQ